MRRINFSYKEVQELKELHRLGFVYKRTKIVPAKADPEKQLEFLDKYKQLKSMMNEEDKIMFMDGVHPQYNTKASCC